MAKSASEHRFVLGVAYQAGRDDRIRKGADGKKDWFSAEQLEKACWSFLPGGGEIGILHADGTTGHVQVVENYIYRGPDWELGGGLIVKAGDWLVGGICDEMTWQLVREGRLTGWSPQGQGRRVVQ